MSIMQNCKVVRLFSKELMATIQVLHLICPAIFIEKSNCELNTFFSLFCVFVWLHGQDTHWVSNYQKHEISSMFHQAWSYMRTEEFVQHVWTLLEVYLFSTKYHFGLQDWYSLCFMLVINKLLLIFDNLTIFYNKAILIDSLLIIFLFWVK